MSEHKINGFFKDERFKQIKNKVENLLAIEKARITSKKIENVTIVHHELTDEQKTEINNFITSLGEP